MTTYFFNDTAALTGRTLRHVTRSMDTIITTAITPVAMMLMFVYVFGGAIDTGSVPYVNYMLPGILLMTIASGISYTAYRLFTDVKSGIFERFQSMPIARSGVLWAHVVTSLVANLIALVLVVGVAVLMGFRSGAGVSAWLAVAGILLLFTLALTWLAVIPGSLRRRSRERARSPTLSSSCRSSVRRSCLQRRCPARCAGSPNISR
ncbi:ABC transporter permease [Streptomyces sp. NPDC097941]|uniref:ABC transporter permease n=1 Tax=Streptomyces sp. NPDC097941 TaxID=3155685 RepID=UPI0033240669